MKPIRIHYLQHVPFEGTGYIAQWARKKGHLLTGTHLYNDEQFPDINEIDWLIIMGGPMSANDTESIVWLQPEKDFIAKAISANKKLIGICLGAQLIASALGSRVYQNNQKEIGWFPVNNPDENNFILDRNEVLPVFHWHGETFDLPENAKLLLSSEGCTNQAYIIDNHILGIQFHFEVTHETLEQMLTFGKDELTGGKYIQTEETIVSNAHYIGPSNKKMEQILNYFVEK